MSDSLSGQSATREERLSRIPALIDLAHELSEALQAIGNYIETLRWKADNNSENPPEQTREILDKAASQILRANRAFKRLRDNLF